MKTKKQIINSLSILTIGIIFALVGLIINRGQNKNNYFLIVGDKIGNNEYVDSLKILIIMNCIMIQLLQAITYQVLNC